MTKENLSTIKVFYRISDKGRPKDKLPFADKVYCLQNAVEQFGKENFYVIADNCKRETIKIIEEMGLSYEETSLGNSGSFMYMITLIETQLTPNEYVYLLEDDYIHLDGSRDILLEGLQIADYVTLYDHPDKYLLFRDGGSPLNFKKIRRTTILVTQKSHWRTIDSTTMTFACKVSTILKDKPVWQKYTDKPNPKDFYGFLELGNFSLKEAIIMGFNGKRKAGLIMLKTLIKRRKGRVIISVLPAMATHVETAWIAPVVNWK